MRWVRLLFLCAATACAQDPFEIHVFEYEPMTRGAWTYEAHMNYFAKGSHDYHFSSEVTAAVTEQFRLAGMLLTTRRPGGSLEYAGWRVLPHLYAPASWHLPLNLGLIAEFAFDENSRRVELHPIIEKHFGRLELDANPSIEHSLSGPETREGWVFEPAGRVGWRASREITPSVEYHSEWGPIRDLSPARQQFHQVLPGADWHIGSRLTWSFGAGYGVTGAGPKVVLKSRVEIELGRRN